MVAPNPVKSRIRARLIKIKVGVVDPLTGIPPFVVDGVGVAVVLPDEGVEVGVGVGVAVVEPPVPPTDTVKLTLAVSG